MISFHIFSFELVSIMHYNHIYLTDFFDVKWKCVHLVALYFAIFHYLFLCNLPRYTNLYWWGAYIRGLSFAWKSCHYQVLQDRSLPTNILPPWFRSVFQPLNCFSLHLFTGFLLEWSRQFLQDQASFLG